MNFFLEKISRPKLPARKEYSTNAGPSEHDRHTNLLGSSFKRIMMNDDGDDQNADDGDDQNYYHGDDNYHHSRVTSL